MIVADHDCVDYAVLADHVPLLVDTRGVIAKLGLRTSCAVAKA
jgi:hypothetical protein